MNLKWRNVLNVKKEKENDQIMDNNPQMKYRVVVRCQECFLQRQVIVVENGCHISITHDNGYCLLNRMNIVKSSHNFKKADEMMKLTMLKALDCTEKGSKLLTYQGWMTNDRLQMITVII